MNNLLFGAEGLSTNLQLELERSLWRRDVWDWRIVVIVKFCPLVFVLLLVFLVLLRRWSENKTEKKKRQWNLPAVATSIWNTHLQVQPIKLQLTNLFWVVFLHMCVLCVYVCLCACLGVCCLSELGLNAHIYYIMQGIRYITFVWFLHRSMEHMRRGGKGGGWWIKHVDRTCFLVVLT